MPLIAPHGGELVNRLIEDEREREEVAARAAHLPAIPLTKRGLADLEMIATGAMSPLTGFMNRDDYTAVVDTMRLRNGLPWTLPVTLPVSAEQAKGLKEGREVALTERGEVIAVLTVGEVYPFDKDKEALEVYRTLDEAHPGVAALRKIGDCYVGGEVRVLRLPAHADFHAYRLTPRQTRAEFRRRGWRRVVGFQTRNPVHRAHEYIQKCALETVDGLLLHPLMGATKADDIPGPVRMRCYEVLFEGYYPKDRSMISIFPAAMRYAGPREAVFHAICRKNYGCSHFIVGRDHAGVGDYYGTFDAHAIFEEFEPDELGVTPMLFDHAFYCRRCGGMASYKTCPHGGEDHVILSGTKVRAMLAEGKTPPPEFTRPEVAAILTEAMRSRRSD